MENLDAALNDVRKAYRLLYDYQRRMLNLMKFIGGKYRRIYDGGHVKFGNSTPRNGGGNLNLMAWDWLSMYYYEFHFQPVQASGQTVHFSVFLMSDTGYFEARKDKNIHQKTVSEYIDVEKSESKLIFVAGQNIWEGWDLNWREVNFTTVTKGEKIDGDKIMAFHHYDLKLFADEDSATECLRHFTEYCNSKGITLPLHESNIPK
jgi:hypothetical protein